jgi:DNA repair protein RadD
LWLIKGDRPLTLFRLFQKFQPDFNNYEEGVVFAGFAKFHSILANRNHSHYTSVRTLIRNARLLIVDEAHTSVAETYEDCINAFVATDNTDIIGLTATPGRTDPEESVDLKRLYSNQLIRVTDGDGNNIDDPIGHLQEGRYLANLTYETFETGLEFSEDKKRILEALACSQERNEKILEQIERAVELAHSTLIFSCTKDHAYALLVLCKSKDILAEVITGDVPQVARLDILDRFRNREFFVLINQNILSTGIDVPNIDRIIVCPPIGSKILYSQILGRALRGPKNGGNENNTVVGIRDNLLNYPSARLIYDSFANEWGQERTDLTT